MDLDIGQAWSIAVSQLDRGTLAISQAWSTATSHLSPEGLSLIPQGEYDPPQDVINAVRLLSEAKMKEDLLQHYLESIRASFSLVQHDVVAHLDQFETRQGAEEEQLFIISALLQRIGFWIHAWQQPISVFWSRSNSTLAAYRRTFLSSLYFILPPTCTSALTLYLRHLLASPSPSGAPSPPHSDQHPLAMPTLITLLDRYDPLLFGLIYQSIEARVHETCAGHFEEPKLKELISWLGGPVSNWVVGIYERNSEGGLEEAKKLLKPTFTRFEYHVHKTLALLRATEMFDIIVDYPASIPALEDIRVCLMKTDLRAHVVSTLRQLMAQRLLHPGADTGDIISQYIATIRCLRILDPAGVLLSRVADPIRKYLRGRDDTIRSIVSRLMAVEEESENALAEEFAATATADGRPVHTVQDASRDEAENYNDPKWVPDPVDAPVDYRKSKGSDVIQLLVSIYDTKDVFIKELQVLLAQRLLAIQDYGLEREIKNVEIFKLRFGDAALAGCEVMIKDLQDSKRIDTRVHDRNQGVPLHATIVSRLFWPSFQPAPLKLPGQLGRAQSEYTKAFTHQRPDKKLRWLPQLGAVNLTIELKDRTLEVEVTPLQASLLELFSSEDTWTTEDLGIELRLTDFTAIRNGLYFWSNLGVLKSLDGGAEAGGEERWKLLEEKDAKVEAAASHVIEEEAQAVQSVEALQIEQMRVYWQYISGMLTNLGTLPLARIHGTLNMLVPTYKGRTTDELVAFLSAMQAEGLVEKTASGSWKIVK